MKKDKTMIRFFEQQKTEQPSSELNHRIMTRVYKNAEQHRKRAEFRNLLLVSIVSLGLIAGTVYLLKDIVQFDLKGLFTINRPLAEEAYLIRFYLLLAVIALFLLLIDGFIRKQRKKHVDP